MKLETPLFKIILITIIIFAPFLFRPELVTAKDNDLGRSSVPTFSFIKRSVVEDQQIPLWRPLQLMGETFVGSPISSLFYPANLIFIAFETNLASILYLMLHIVLAGTSTFLLARSLKLSEESSLLSAFIYAFSIKLLTHTAAGHITMVAAFSYFPLVMLSVKKLTEKPNFNWFLIGSLSGSFMYMTFPTIFYYTAIFIGVYTSYEAFLVHSKKRTNLVTPLLMLVVALLISAISLLPHMEFGPFSTRSSLTITDVAQPLWNFKKFISSLIFPYTDLGSFDHEELLYFGFVPITLATLGFYFLRGAHKLALTVFGLVSLLFAAGLSTPFFSIAYSLLPFLNYSRMTTRFWFIPTLAVSLLAAYGLDKIKNKKIAYLAITLFLAESLFISYQMLSSIPNLNSENSDLYRFLVQNSSNSRTYCTSGCFNPQYLEKNKILILNGENPIQQASFIDFLQKAGGYTHSEFAVIFPPYQVWQRQNPAQPNAELLGRAGVQFVASTYDLNSADLRFIDKFENVLLYENTKFKPVARFTDSNEKVVIRRFASNIIDLEFKPRPSDRELEIAQNYYPGWVAYSANGKADVQESDGVFQKVKVPANSQSIEVKYEPRSFKIGAIVTALTLLGFLFYFWHIRFKSRRI
ncbi:MAG: YfhO family protein [Candidatus Curtissbacteria bacterium]|nr:YfhO family protein [Candidatus Curtissbacteria bacterium]